MLPQTEPLAGVASPGVPLTGVPLAGVPPCDVLPMGVLERPAERESPSDALLAPAKSPERPELDGGCFPSHGAMKALALRGGKKLALDAANEPGSNLVRGGRGRASMWRMASSHPLRTSSSRREAVYSAAGSGSGDDPRSGPADMKRFSLNGRHHMLHCGACVPHGYRIRCYFSNKR